MPRTVVLALVGRHDEKLCEQTDKESQAKDACNFFWYLVNCKRKVGETKNLPWDSLHSCGSGDYDIILTSLLHGDPVDGDFGRFEGMHTNAARVLMIHCDSIARLSFSFI